MLRNSVRRTMSVARKEFLHLRRDPQTLFITLLFPILELFLFGYAIETNVRDIRTVVLDQAGTQESRALLQRFENSKDFKIVARVFSDEELTRSIVAGKARVGVKIPSDYSRRTEAGEPAEILVLVDGTVASVAAEAVNVGSAIGLRESIERGQGGRSLLVNAKPRVLFNPDTRSPNFFIPGLMVIVCQMMATLLSANAIVREKENGTLEQLYMTPVRRGELLVGKMAPYLGVTLLEFCIITLLMRTVFQVPIHGVFLTLLALALPFGLTMLGLGLWISTCVSTRDGACQGAIGTILPSIFLSGYVFPLDSMQPFFQQVANFIPASWLIDAARGVILRGAGWAELWPHSVVLWLMALVMLSFSSLKIRKQLT